MPDTFSTPETTIERINRNTWQTEYEVDARDDDAYTRFLDRESPNTLEPDQYGNEIFTFWTVDYAARDGYYALSVVQEIVRLFVAKLNFVFHERQRGRSQPTNSDRPPYARWSPLQEPFFYLIFNGEDYVNYQPMDFDYRRRSLASKETVDAMERFQELPDLPVENDDRDSLDETLVNALFAYQDGITASTPQQSFFSFWRGMENLTHVEPEQRTRCIMERARPLFETETEDEYVPQYQRDAVDELYQKRNHLAHTGPHIRIQESHRTVVKRMLDKLLTLHVDRYTEYDETDFKTFLIHYAKSLKGNKQALKRNKRENQILRDVMLEGLQRESDSLFLKTM